jgi:hypothetical protein
VERAIEAISQYSDEQVKVKTVTVVECQSEHMAQTLRTLLARIVAEPAPEVQPARYVEPKKKSAWAQTPIEKVCGICGETFTAQRSTARYCDSPECRAEQKHRSNQTYKTKNKAGGEPVDESPLSESR